MAGVCSGPGPCDTTPVGTPGGRQNWVDKTGGLPDYIRAIAHSLQRKGRTESEAIQLAVGTVQRWARGEGGVTAATRARAVKALAEWEAKKTAAHTLTAPAASTVDLASVIASTDGPSITYRAGQRFRHGWIPILPTGEAQRRLRKTLLNHVGAVITAKRKHGEGSPEHKAALDQLQRTHRAINRLRARS